MASTDDIETRWDKRAGVPMACADDIETRWARPRTRPSLPMPPLPREPQTQVATAPNHVTPPPKNVYLLVAAGLAALLLALQAAAIVYLIAVRRDGTGPPPRDAVATQQATTKYNAVHLTRRTAEDGSGSVWDAVQALRKAETSSDLTQVTAERAAGVPQAAARVAVADEEAAYNDAVGAARFPGDPGEAYPNIGYVGRGYNLFEGYPLFMQGSVDPGFREPVVATSYSERQVSGSGRLVPDGINVFETPAADFALSHQLVTTEFDMSATHENTVDVKVSAELGISSTFMEAMGSVAFQYNREFKQNTEEARSSEVATLYTTGKVSTYEARVGGSHFRVSDAFHAAVLAAQSDPASLIQRFGTHFVSSVRMGGRATQRITMSKQALESALETEESTNINMAVGIGAKAKSPGFGMSVKAEVSASRSTFDAQSARNAMSRLETQVRTNIVGGTPALGSMEVDDMDMEHMERWASSVAYDPAPISYSLSLLSDAITPYAFPELDAERLGRLRHSVETALVRLCGPACVTDAAPTRQAFDVALPFGCSTLPAIDAPELEIGSCPAPSLSILSPAPSCDDGMMSAVWVPAAEATSMTLRRTRALVFSALTSSGRRVARVFPIGGTQVTGDQFYLSGGTAGGRYCVGRLTVGGGTSSGLVPKDGDGQTAMILWKTSDNCPAGVTDAYRHWSESEYLPFGTVLDMVAYVPYDAIQLNAGETIVSSTVGMQDVVVAELGPQVVAVVRAWNTGDPDSSFLQVTQLPRGVLRRDAGFVFVSGIRNNGRYCARASLGTSLDIHPRFGASPTDVIVWDGAAHSYCGEGIRVLAADDPKVGSVHAHVDTTTRPTLDVNAGRLTFVEVQRNVTNGELPGGLVAVVVAHTTTTLIHKAFAIPGWYVNGHVGVTGEPVAGGTDQGKACKLNAVAGKWHTVTITAERHLFVVAGYWMCQCHWKTPGVSERDDIECTHAKYYEEHNDRVLAHVTLEDLGIGNADTLTKVEVAVMRVDNYNATRQPAAFAPASPDSGTGASHVRWQCESTPLRFGDRVRVATAFGRQLVLPRGSVTLSAGGFTSLIPQCPAGAEIHVHRPATTAEESLKSAAWFTGSLSALRLRAAPTEATNAVTVTVTLGNLTTASFSHLLPAGAGAPTLWVSGQRSEGHYALVNDNSARDHASVELGGWTTDVSFNGLIDFFVFAREESAKAGFRKFEDATEDLGRPWSVIDTAAMLIHVNLEKLGLPSHPDSARQVEQVKVSYAAVTTPIAQASCEGHEWNRCGGAGGGIDIDPSPLPSAELGGVVVAWECTGATEHPPFQLVSPRPSRNMRREPVRFGDLVLLAADGCGLATLQTDAGGLWKPIQCVSPLSSATRLRIEGGTPGGVVSNMAEVSFTVLDTNNNEHRDMLQDVSDTQLLSRMAGGCVTNDMEDEDLPLVAQIAKQAHPTMVTSPTRLPQWLATCDVDSRWTLNRVTQDEEDVEEEPPVTFAVSLQQDTPAKRGDTVAVWVDVVFSEPVLNPAAPNSRMRTAPSPLGVMPALVTTDFELFLGTADANDGCATMHDQVAATELWFRPGGRAPDAYALEGYFATAQVNDATCVGVRVAPATVGHNGAALESTVQAVPFTPPAQASFVCRNVSSIALPVGVFDPAVRSLASTAYGYLQCDVAFAGPVVSVGFTRAAPDDLSVHTTCTSPQLPLTRLATSTHPVHVESAVDAGVGINGWRGSTKGVTRLTAWMDIEAMLPDECARLIVPGDPLGPIANLEVKLAGAPGRLVQVSQPHYAVPETPFTGSFEMSIPFKF